MAPIRRKAPGEYLSSSSRSLHRTSSHKRYASSDSSSVSLLTAILLTVTACCISGYVCVSLIQSSRNHTGLFADSKSKDWTWRHRHAAAIAGQRQQQQREGHGNMGGLPSRLQDMMRKHQIVGARIADVKNGKATVHQILRGSSGANQDGHELEAALAKKNKSGQVDLIEVDVPPDTPPMTMDEISTFIMTFLHRLHEINKKNKLADFFDIWQSYHDLVVKTLYPWDREYLQRMPPRREDGSIFLSVATYRDENCLNTITEAYQMAKYPEKLYVGLVQQNCVKDCKSGVLSNLRMEPVEPDQDCYAAFCASPLGKPHCEANRVRSLFFNEDESLGPYAARYFASKLWYGESWYMQIDAHMFFAQDWDADSIDMLKNAPSEKPVISHYPPPDSVDLKAKRGVPAPRLCGPVFATSDLEAQIIRLEGSGNYDNKRLEVPRFAPFTAAGYFVAYSDILREVPFDPFLPWIFMGEEIIMSSRLWTSGYDIFSPTHSVLSHIYVRRHKPKFWESVHRLFKPGVHNPLQMLVLNRIKYQLGYPEASKDYVRPKSLLTAVEQYGMGKVRPIEAYLEMVGLDMRGKKVKHTGWCEKGRPPPGFEQFDKLYP